MPDENIEAKLENREQRRPELSTPTKQVADLVAAVGLEPTTCGLWVAHQRLMPNNFNNFLRQIPAKSCKIRTFRHYAESRTMPHSA
jgi:hypothetical protein